MAVVLFVKMQYEFRIIPVMIWIRYIRLLRMKFAQTDFLAAIMALFLNVGQRTDMESNPG
mgnify:FL=1